MGYRRRYKKRSYRRRYGRKRSNFKLMKRTIKKVLYQEAESKFLVTNINSSINQASDVETVWSTGINVGTGNEQRIGSKIAVKNISMDLQCSFFQGTNGSNGAFVRVIVLWPRKGLATGDAQLYLTSSNPGIFGIPDPDQYITMYDRRVYLAGINTGGGNPLSVRYRYNHYCKMMKWTFDDQDGQIGCREPLLYITTNLNAVNESSTVNINGYKRISFKDI